MLLCNQAESSEETIKEKSLIKGQGVTMNVSKVRTFWETPKIWKNLPHSFDKSADLLSKRQNHEEDFFQIMCASQKVSDLLYEFLKISNFLLKNKVHFTEKVTKSNRKFFSIFSDILRKPKLYK